MLKSLLAFFLQTFLKQICRYESEEGSGTAASQGHMKWTRKKIIDDQKLNRLRVWLV